MTGRLVTPPAARNQAEVCWLLSSIEFPPSPGVRLRRRPRRRTIPAMTVAVGAICLKAGQTAAVLAADRIAAGGPQVEHLSYELADGKIVVLSDGIAVAFAGGLESSWAVVDKI